MDRTRQWYTATLREIAGKAQWVLKTPEPDVLFSDFGDSALIFKLRVGARLITWSKLKRIFGLK